MNLTKEIQTVNDYTAHVQKRATDLGLTIELDTDAHAFKRFLAAQEDSHGVATTLNPDCCLIPQNQFVWFLIKDGSRGVCCHALRIFRTDGLMRDIMTNRLFSDLRVSWTTKDVRLLASSERTLNAINGTIATGGGFWVDPDYRGQDFSFLFIKLLRVLACRDFHIDHYVSFILGTPERKAWAAEINGNHNMVDLSKGYWPGYDTPQNIVMPYATRRGLLSQAHHEIANWDAVWSEQRSKAARRARASSNENIPLQSRLRSISANAR